MQRLQLASDDPTECARAVMETVPGVFQFIRFTASRHRKKGLAVQQFRALAYLHRRPGHSLSLLADYLGLSLAATSRLIDSLVERKLVERVAMPSNRRKVCLTSTRRGKEVFDEVFRWTQSELAQKLTALPAARRRSIIAVVRDLEKIFQI
jgi:DNA-binding MarR family transcriptional regulator